MPRLTYLFTLLFCCFQTITLACNTSDHHSVLSHYNHAKKIFQGKVLKIGKENQKKFSFEDYETGLRSIFVKLEVTHNYKNATIKEEVIIGLLPGVDPDFKLGEQYLIYANRKAGYDFLVCEKGFLMTDTVGLSVHQFLFKIPINHTGYIAEYTALGTKWAEGLLENGLAVGAWTFYSKAGEIQISGRYETGEEIGEWTYFYHTLDDNFHILNEIITGAYFELTGTYQLIQLDTNLSGEFKNQIHYLVDKDTIVEQYYYNKQLLEKKVSFENGLRQGKEERFDENGSCISFYTFEKDVLEGAFFEFQPLRQQENVWLKVEGTYKADKRLDEEHLYYEGEQLVKTKVVLLNGKLLE